MESRKDDPPFVVVGHITKPHGTKGEFFVWPLTDHPDTTFVPGAILQLADASGSQPDPAFGPLRITEVRPYRRGVLVHARGVPDRNAADLIRDRYLLRPFEETEPLDEGEIFYHQLLGLQVLTREGEAIGRVTEVYGLRPADLLEVSGAGKSRLIPLTRELLVGWDLEAGTLTIDPPEGLLDL